MFSYNDESWTQDGTERSVIVPESFLPVSSRAGVWSQNGHFYSTFISVCQAVTEMGKIKRWHYQNISRNPQMPSAYIPLARSMPQGHL